MTVLKSAVVHGRKSFTRTAPMAALEAHSRAVRETGASLRRDGTAVGRWHHQSRRMRMVLGLGLSAVLNAPNERTGLGVFWM